MGRGWFVVWPFKSKECICGQKVVQGEESCIVCIKKEAGKVGYDRGYTDGHRQGYQKFSYGYNNNIFSAYDQTRGQQWYNEGVKVGYNQGFNAGRLQARTITPTIDLPQDILKSMISLCHPDKHGGSVTATKVTQYLLSKRTK